MAEITHESINENVIRGRIEININIVSKKPVPEALKAIEKEAKWLETELKMSY